MYISVCTSASKSYANQTHFNTIQLNGWSSVSLLVCRHVWSPIIWKGGHRLSDNYEASYFVGIDVDDGLSLEEALRYLKENELGHVVATTKSHQLPKNGEGPRDRFRVILRWDTPIYDLDLYQYNVKRLVSEWEADRSATDGARMFQPCKEIVSVSSGDPVKVRAKPRRSAALERYRAAQRAERMAEKKPARWASEFLEAGRLDSSGGRKRTIYSVACELLQVGWREPDVILAIRGAPISWDGIKECTVSQAVKSAARKFRG